MKTKRLVRFGVRLVFVLLFFAVILQLSAEEVADNETNRPYNRSYNPPSLMRETFFTCLGGFISGGIGFGTAFWLNRRQRAQDRKKDQLIRKQNFRCMLAELSSKIERLSGLPEPRPVDELFRNYIFFVHDFHKERVRVAGDFLPEQKFIALCDKFGRLKYEDITKDPNQRIPRDVIAEALKAIIEFTNAA